MELFSKPFTAKIRRLFDEHPSNILATIPVAARGGGKPLPLLDQIRGRADAIIIIVRLLLPFFWLLKFHRGFFLPR